MDIAKQIEGTTVINRAETETHHLEVYNQITQELREVKEQLAQQKQKNRGKNPPWNRNRNNQ